MDIASRMIERGEIDYALVVDGETADLAYEKTLERLRRSDITEEQFRNEMATLTLGSGAAAMVLARAELAPGAPRYKRRRHPRGDRVERAVPRQPRPHGHRHPHAADRRHEARAEDLRRAPRSRWAGWSRSSTSSSSTRSARCTPQAFIQAFGIDPKKVLTIFGEHGNIGPASVPIVLSKLRELGRLKKGDRVALLGIGSGLNCSMAEVVW